MTDPASSHAESSSLRSLLRGLWLPLVTPFSDDVVDEISLRRLVHHYAKLPIDGLILAATSGEGLTLGMAELEWIVAVTRDVITEGKRYLPICLGLAGSHTRKMCHTLDETAGWPIDGYLISSPYYSRPSQRGLVQHFKTLAGHASWPIVLYNIPYRASVNLETDTLLELARHPNIRRHEGLRRQPRAINRPLAAPASRLSCSDRRGRSVFRGASAANLKFLSVLRQVRLGNFKFKAALETISC